MAFADLKDQRTVAETLQRSLKRGRLAHAYLLAGPRGTGKEAMARTLAKALNCLDRELDSCDRCDSCRRVDDGSHPDVYWVRPESRSRRIAVDQIREFAKAVNLKPSLARMKVGVVVDADCMGEEASNAFLKTLEEPPAQTIILLLSAEPQRLLPTILSRCLRVSFGQPAQRAQLAYGERVLPLLSEFRGTGGDRVRAAYRLLAAMNGILQEIRQEIHQRAETEANLDRFAEMDPKTRERLEDQMTARVEGEYRAAREQLLEEMYRWYGDVLLCVHGIEEGLLEHPEHVEITRQLAKGLSCEQAESNLETIEQVRDSLARHVMESLALEVGLLKLTS